MAYIRTVAALVLVLGLAWALLWLLRRFGIGGMVARTVGRRRRLDVVETHPLDGRRRLVLIRRDGVEHLLLVGGSAEMVVERGIVPPSDAGSGQPEAKGESEA